MNMYSIYDMKETVDCLMGTVRIRFSEYSKKLENVGFPMIYSTDSITLLQYMIVKNMTDNMERNIQFWNDLYNQKLPQFIRIIDYAIQKNDDHRYTTDFLIITLLQAMEYRREVEAMIAEMSGAVSYVAIAVYARAATQLPLVVDTMES
jgi:hypothetical protein